MEHALEMGVILVQLGTEHTVVPVGDLRQTLIGFKSVFGKQRQAHMAFVYRHIADDDHGAAAGGNGLHFVKVLLSPQAHGRGGENDSVFQSKTAVAERAGDLFILFHVMPHLSW